MRKQILEINEKLRIGAIEEKEAQRLLLILFGVIEPFYCHDKCVANACEEYDHQICKEQCDKCKAV